MVNERKNNGGDGEIVNSTSLEDVDQNEISDTRAHSVTSIHTASDPNTPTYEELQSKLETSNRNIQNIKDQQQQLLRLQQAAKQHLLEMENIRNQTRSVGGQSHRNADGVPEYETVDQVHDDMSNLVNRMKTLTTFIQGQHELSALLGEDGPDVLAEQEALQRKLEELKAQKQDMKNLVSELQEISSSAERAAQTQQQQQQPDEPRVVPVDYQRVVPIELIGAAKQQSNTSGQQHKPIQNGHYQHHNGVHNGLASHSDDTSDELNSENNLDEDNPEMVAETTELIRQKMADINAMKNQLKRLKDMMETVRMIEEKTEGKAIKEIGNEVDEEEEPVLSQRESPQKLLNRNSASAALLLPVSSERDGRTMEEEEMSEKVRMLHEMTEDLRQQARQMSSERERLKAIKDELKRRNEMASKNSIRENSISRSMSGTNSNLNNDPEKQLLEAEYEAKKKEFEKLCQRLQEEDAVDGRSDDVQEEPETKPELTQQYNRDNWRCSNVASIPSVHSLSKGQSDVGMTPLRGKDSADSGAVDVHGQPSIEAASFKSGSSRSYSVPPPMRSINNREMSWRKNSQDNASSQFNHFMAPPPPPPIPSQSGMPATWNPAYYYSTPYAQQQQCSSHFHSGGGGGECCTHQCHSNSALNGSNPQLGTNPISNDPVLLQQFIQTQQMLINSVSQCNQLLWHQQKEINNLNNAVVLLQERLLNSPEINPTRAESAPNPTASTFCIQAAGRAQSEQPQPYPQQQQQPMSPTIRSHHHAHQNIFHHYRRNITQTPCGHSHCCGGGNASTNTSYNNFPAEQQGTSVTNLCSQVVPPTQPSNQNFLNNDIPPNSTGPGPIFMHHHNNTITPMQHHHNNSNLLNSQQNCLNSPNPPNSQSAAVAAAVSTSGTTNNINSVPNTSSNAAAAAAALNNQVPPGNRANNYWDNFRSYSRQNLLSSNSCKSNEEQNHYYQQMNPSSIFGQNLLSSSSSSVTNQNLNGFRNLYQQQQQQQQQGINNCNGGSSNVTAAAAVNGGIIANLDANKHVHTFRNQFNNINVLDQQQPQQQQQPHENSLHDVQQQNILNTTGPPPQQPTAPSNMENFEQHQQQQQQNLNLNDDELFNYNNHNGNNVAAAIFGSPDFRNMNFMNFGINEFQKKIPYKTPCNSSSNTKRSRNSQSSPLLNEIYFNQRMMNNIENNGSMQQQQQQNESCENMATIHPTHYQQQQQLTSAIDTRATIGDNRDQLNQFGFGAMNNNIHRSLGERNSASADAAAEGGSDNQNDIPEEMKRNLLKNALKNDKFTSKFFESLRENVCCEIHSILHRTDTLNPQCLLQFLKELHNYNVYKRSYSNGGGTESNDDDSNEFCDGDGDENIRNRQQQQQYLQAQSLSSLQQQIPQMRNNNNTNNQIQLQHQQQQGQISNKDSSNSIIDETVRGENNRDNEIMNSLINSQDLRRLAYKIMFESATSGEGEGGEREAGGVLTLAPPPAPLTSSSSSTRSEKDKKIGLKYDKMSSSQRSSPKIPNEVYRPDYELVNYLMSNIRNNIRQSQIDDETIIRIAQLTTSALENRQILQTQSLSSSPLSCSLQIDRNLISQKELYRRMKSFEVRNRDKFLIRYETYLQTLFVMKVSNEDSTMNNVNLISDKKILDNTNNITTTSVRSGSDVNLTLNYNTENNQNIRKISQIQNTNSKSNISLGERTTVAVIASSTSSNEMAADNEMNLNKTSADSTVDAVSLTGGGGGGGVQQTFGMVNSRQQGGQQNEQMVVSDGGNTAAMFFRNASVYHHQHHHLSPDTSSNVVSVAAATGTGVTTTATATTNTMNNSNNIMNEDLAEADQICSSNNVAVCTGSGDGNCLISIQQQQQQHNGNNSLQSSLPLLSNHNQQKQTQTYRQQIQHQCLETTVGDYFNDHHYQSINSTASNNINHETGIINGTRDNIQSLPSNYSNFISVPSSLNVTITNHHQQQQQQKHHYNNRGNGNLIVDGSGGGGGEYESQYFKKYWDGIQNVDSGGLRDDDTGGNVMLKCQGLGKKYDNNGMNGIDNDIMEDEVEYDRNENMNGGCVDGDDDDDDEEEDDRAQFMMTDAACALVFPIISTQQNSSMNCIQAADSSTSIDYGTSNSITPKSGSRLPTISTTTAFIGDISSTKRNSVP